jgi:GDP-L-fucose synthase
MVKNKIAILGGNGFLGNCFAQKLPEKYFEILPVTRKDVDLRSYLDVKNWCEKNKPDYIINCATAGNKKSFNYYDEEEFQNNLDIFLNVINYGRYKKIINIGSGAEFDLTCNIDRVEEGDIFYRYPKDSYGYSKNKISRISVELDNAYILRVFGCFDHTEPNFRLFAKHLNGDLKSIDDREFDYISADDLTKILLEVIFNDNIPRDINCVYREKLYLSDILNRVSLSPFKINSVSEKNYTASGKLLSSLNLDLIGLDRSIQNYIERR